jgi:hypothetical protein
MNASNHHGIFLEGMSLDRSDQDITSEGNGEALKPLCLASS